MNRSLLHAFTTIVLLCFSLPAISQNFPMLHFTTEDGLPSNAVYEVYRDSKGFLWFATDKGIVRYNGIRFEKFNTFNGLPDNEIFFFQEDNYGRLWLGTYNGELCYYKDDTFHTAANTPFLRMPFKISYIKEVSIEKDKTVTIRFNENSIFLNIDKNEINFYNLDNAPVLSRSMSRIIHMTKLSDSGYQVFWSDSSIRINNSYEIVKKEKNYYNDLRCYACQNVKYFFTDKFIFDGNMRVIGRFKDSPLNTRLIQRVYYDGKNVFCAYNNGLVINDSIQVFNNNNVSSVTRDNIGNYWISTLNNGIYCIYKDFFSTQLIENVYKQRIVYSCVRNNKLFFVTADNNLFYLENEKAKCLFNYAEYNDKSQKQDIEPGYYLDNSYKYYNFYNNEHITIDNVLSDKKIIKKYANNTFGGNIKNILSADDNIYLQNRLLIVKIDYKNINPGDDIGAHVSNFINDMPNPDRIFCMAKAPDNSIWYSTINNFYKIVNGQGKLQQQFKMIAFKNFKFYGSYLVGYTHNNQLLVYGDIEKKMWVDSIPPQNCIWNKFYQLDANHIMISTDNQYRVLNLDQATSGKKISISVIDNPFIPFQPESICADSANCYFFKNGSITSISIKSLLSEAAPPKLLFSFLKTGKKSYPIHNEIQIPFSESKNMSISFSTISFGGKDIAYQYSVSKNDNDNWRDVKGEEINFINSGYGKYIIKVKAKTISSGYSNPIVFTVYILRPLWARWWFIVLSVCSAIALIIVVIRSRILYLVRKNEKIHDTEIKFMRSEYKALNALMNPHFIFNTLNNVQGLVNRNDKLAANEYLRVFADLIRQNMHNISKELIPLQKEVDLVNNYLLLEKLRFKEMLHYSINIGEDLDLSDILIPPLLVQPLVENSIKHGILPMESAEGLIQINIYERNGILYIEVKDNGVGISASGNKGNSLHESFGLENIKKRIEQLSIIQNKKISFHISEITEDDGKMHWTIATISMPVSL